MKPVSELLREQGFTQDAALHHQELIPFIRTYLFRKNRITISFLTLNILFAGSWLSLCMIHIYNDTISSGQAFAGFGYGCAITFLLAPIHELLHGVAYRLKGAQNVIYKANWKKLYFMAIADRFVTERRAFYFIGLTPFVVLSAGLILLSFVTGALQQVMWLTALWVHASMCTGDFGLMSYFAENKNKEVVTYDDAGEAVSYFYSRKYPA